MSPLREWCDVKGVVFHPTIQTVVREKDPTKWYRDMVEDLADIGDSPNSLNEFGEAPLGVAANKGAGLVVEQLLVRPETDVNLVGRRGRSPLYLAADQGHVYIVKLLLKHPDIDVNAANAPAGATALMAASRRGHSRIVELLLLHPDIDIDSADRDGFTAISNARTKSIKFKLSRRDRSRSLQDIVIHSQAGRDIGSSSSRGNCQLTSRGQIDRLKRQLTETCDRDKRQLTETCEQRSSAAAVVVLAESPNKKKDINDNLGGDDEDCAAVSRCGGDTDDDNGDTDGDVASVANDDVPLVDGGGGGGRDESGRRSWLHRVRCHVAQRIKMCFVHVSRKHDGKKGR